MEWSMTLSIEFKNDVAEKAIDILKEIYEKAPWKNDISSYKRNIAAGFCWEMDELLETENYEPNKIFVFDTYEGAYTPYDTGKVMKSVLEYLAKQMPNELFESNIECSGTYDECEITAKYDGKTLFYDSFYSEICWDELICEECDNEWTIEEVSEDGIYICPVCGAEVEKEIDAKRIKVEIPIH